MQVSSRPRELHGSSDSVEIIVPRTNATLEVLVRTWADRRACLPVAVVVSIFDDVLSRADDSRSEHSDEPLRLRDIELDDNGTAWFRGPTLEPWQLGDLMRQTLGALGDEMIPAAAWTLLGRLEAASSTEPEWFRAELRQALGSPAGRDEVRAIVESLAQVTEEEAALLSEGSLLDADAEDKVETAHETFIDPSPRFPTDPPTERPTTASELPVLPETALAQEAALAQEGAWAEEVVQTDRPAPSEEHVTERPVPMGPEAHLAPTEVVGFQSVEEPTEDLDDEAAATKDEDEELASIISETVRITSETIASELPAADEPEVDPVVEAAPVETRPTVLDDQRPRVRVEPSRQKPVSLTAAPAARVRTITQPPDEGKVPIRIPAEDRGRIWAMIVFVVVVGFVAAWAFGYV